MDIKTSPNYDVQATASECTTVTKLAAGVPATSPRTITMYDMDFVGNWGAEWQQDGSICYSNVSAPVSQKELVYFDSKPIPTVSNNLKLNTSMQSAIKGVHYGVRHEECMVTYLDDVCGIPKYIDPIVSDFHVRHPNSNLITDEIVLEHVGKTLSAFIQNGSTASTPKTRLAALMRGLKQVNSN